MDVATAPAAGTRRLLQGIGRLADDTTPGQRWTAALAVGLAVLLLAFGLPHGVRTIVEPATRAATPVGAAAPPAGVPAEAPAGVAAGIPAASRRGPVAPAAASGAAPAGDAAAPATPVPAGVVVLAFGDPDDETGDRAVATHFFALQGADAEIVEVDDADPAAACAAVAGAALVVAGGPMPGPVRDCATRAGARTLAFDDDLAPAAGPASSTRRGVARSLLDTADVLGDELSAPVVLVADERYQPAVEGTRAEAAERGLALDEIVYLPDDGDPSPTTSLDLARARPGTVLFATSTDRQAELATRLSLLSPGTAHVVLDAADSLLDGSYPPTMDGALAVTTLQHPWHEGDAAARQACTSSWSSAHEGAEPLDGEALLRVLLWCQHAELAARLVAADLEIPADLLVPSPITSPIGVVDGALGPTARAVATWSLECGCWSATRPFEAPS
ncbi:MAG TPA: hypothetical protein VFU14_20515 [Acidimicrobiales bacterium]|nr:hypothetical protein [Acidimicrobiales bacterium]